MSKKVSAETSAKVSQSVELIDNSVTVSDNGKYLIIVKSILPKFIPIIKEKDGKEVATGRVHVADYKPFEVIRKNRKYKLTCFVTTTLEPGIEPEKKEKPKTMVEAFSI